MREIPNFAELGAIPKELLEDLVRISAEQQASRDERNSPNQDVIESQFADGFKLLGMASSLAASIGETLRITLVTSTALAIPLQAEGQVRIARGIEFLRVFFESDDTSVEEPDGQ